jgi:transposase
MERVATVGLDIAKSVFQVHGINAIGTVAVRRKLSRGRVLAFFEALPPCLVGMEACNTSHHWARELIALGHDVRLMPAQYVKPYVKRVKNDAADAEAICEAVTRPTMRFVPVKTPEQQSVMMLHRVHPAAHPAHERHAGSHGGFRLGGAGRAHGSRAVARHRRRPGRSAHPR